MSAIERRLSLAVITRGTGGDGVAYAGRLLERALAAISGYQPRVLALSRRGGRGPTIVQETRFVGKIAIAQLRECNPWLFNHVGIARAQNAVPWFVRRPYAVLLCGIEVWDRNLSGSRKRTLQNAAARIAISRHTAKRVATAHPEIGPIVVCPLALLPQGNGSDGVDLALLQKVRARSILVVGRMSRSEQYKGHDELLECWKGVSARVPTAQLVVVGTGDDANRLRAKAEGLGIAGDILFTGFVGDATLEALRRVVAVFALPSRGEGFGLVYLEAMRAGLPCVGGTEDAAREVIVDGETGVLVDPSDREALAHTLVRMLIDPEIRAAYGAAGRIRFEEMFTFERYCNRLRDVLEGTFA